MFICRNKLNVLFVQVMKTMILNLDVMDHLKDSSFMCYYNLLFFSFFCCLLFLGLKWGRFSLQLRISLTHCCQFCCILHPMYLCQFCSTLIIIHEFFPSPVSKPPPHPSDHVISNTRQAFTSQPPPF